MCGIAGFWRPENGAATAHLSALRRMTNALAHRGPDAFGHWIEPKFGVALGHRRLSIIDLSPTGAQAMHSASGRFIIVFNGEIYNFLPLRQELMTMGASFQGTSDTEVLLAAFEQWGIARTLPRVSGMFAFAVWDAKTSELWLARDRMGEKPLYIAQFNGLLAFASELKAFQTLPDFPTAIEPAAMSDLMRNAYIGGRHTVYRAVSRLRPGEFAVVALINSVPVARGQNYWNLHDHLPGGASESYSSDDAATDALDELLTEVVRDEMVADVPVGAARIPRRDDRAAERASQANKPWRIGPLLRGCRLAGSAPCRRSCGLQHRLEHRANVDSRAAPSFESGLETGRPRVRPIWPSDFRTTRPSMSSEAHAPDAPAHLEPNHAQTAA